ncbi:hypothetical protein LWI29_009703 [Acer saccharum]|uniref:Uncharacterized protein n=1 Tax=Acer saccharum TaxID=4024 RepID=A0AA39RGE0_ACESA|nr:hypothetical protein LWI29_009703 [Acer saccharum]
MKRLGSVLGWWLAYSPTSTPPFSSFSLIFTASSPSSFPAIVESRRPLLLHFKKSCNLWLMKYVRPCSLFYEMHKRAMELAGKKAVGPQLLGLNVLEKYVTISISDPKLLIAIHYGLVERERRNMHTIANLFRTLIPRYNLEGAVIGCPDAENTDNLEVAKVKSFVEDLCNTRKLEGLKYTYWDKRFAPARNSIRMEHDEGIEVYDNELSSVFILQGYLDHCGRKEKPGPFERRWYYESKKALYLEGQLNSSQS